MIKVQGLKARFIDWVAQTLMNRAFSPQNTVRLFPGALPQAGMKRAVGA